MLCERRRTRSRGARGGLTTLAVLRGPAAPRATTAHGSAGIVVNGPGTLSRGRSLPGPFPHSCITLGRRAAVQAPVADRGRPLCSSVSPCLRGSAVHTAREQFLCAPLRLCGSAVQNREHRREHVADAAAPRLARDRRRDALDVALSVPPAAAARRASRARGPHPPWSPRAGARARACGRRGGCRSRRRAEARKT